MSDMQKPWAGEFPVDDPDELDDQAIDIIVANMNAGRDRCADCGEPGERIGHQTCQYPQDH